MVMNPNLLVKSRMQLIPCFGDEVTTGTIQTWVNAPMVVALIFGLAGGFFIAILFLRRRK